MEQRRRRLKEKEEDRGNPFNHETGQRPKRGNGSRERQRAVHAKLAAANEEPFIHVVPQNLCIIAQFHDDDWFQIHSISTCLPMATISSALGSGSIWLPVSCPAACHSLKSVHGAALNAEKFPGGTLPPEYSLLSKV